MKHWCLEHATCFYISAVGLVYVLAGVLFSLLNIMMTLVSTPLTTRNHVMGKFLGRTVNGLSQFYHVDWMPLLQHYKSTQTPQSALQCDNYRHGKKNMEQKHTRLVQLYQQWVVFGGALWFYQNTKMHVRDTVICDLISAFAFAGKSQLTASMRHSIFLMSLVCPRHHHALCIAVFKFAATDLEVSEWDNKSTVSWKRLSLQSVTLMKPLK